MEGILATGAHAGDRSAWTQSNALSAPVRHCSDQSSSLAAEIASATCRFAVFTTI